MTSPFEGKRCWYRVGAAENHPWTAGEFCGWFQDYEELETGHGLFPSAVIIDSETRCSLVVPAAGCVCFASVPPTSGGTAQ